MTSLLTSLLILFLSFAIAVGVNKRMVDLKREENGSSSSHHHRYESAEDHDIAFDHEAILGSKKDAEEFTSLNPEEAKRRLKELLGKMDLNHDDIIDKSELHAWIIRSLKSLYKQDAIEHFEATDKDYSSFVSWEEYKGSVYGASNWDAEKESHFLPEEQYVFKAADKDGDGNLNSKEYNSFIHPGLDVEMPPRIVEQILDHKDTDKDGSLSLKEFLGDQTKDHDEEWSDYEMTRFINELDKNRDSSLNSEEIIAWIIPSGTEQIATEEVDHLFSVADGEKDGFLSFEEVLNNANVFVGSGATGYGDHLTNMHRFKEEL